MEQVKDLNVLLIGVAEDLSRLLLPMLDGLKVKQLNKADEIDTFLENYRLDAGTPVFISNGVEGMSAFEIGQTLGSSFQGLHIVFLTFDRSSFEVEKLKKNGFTESFLLPLDKGVLSEFALDLKRKKAGGAVKKYKSVKLIDIQPGQELPFEVHMFLPMNNKYVSLTGSGKISDKKHGLLKQKNVNSICIDVEQIDKFYEFSAEQLIQAGESTNEAMSATEKAERMQSSVRELFRSVLDSSHHTGDFDKGRDLLDQSKKIVSSYVEKKVGLNMQDKLKELMGEGRDSYSHAQVVSTVACLLSIATGIGQPEDLAIAGLFHDIGVQGPYGELSIFELDGLTEKEKSEYMQHPRISLNLLKEKRITLTPIVAEIIEKHHERVDGKGPLQLLEHKIPLEAQLLAYADAFEYLTRAKPSRPTPSIDEVHLLITAKLGLSNELLNKVRGFLSSISV